MHTPEPTPIRPLSFAERFWEQARAERHEDEAPEPLRSVLIVRLFLAALDRLDAGPRRAAPALVALLRQAELEGDLSYASPEQVRGEILDTRSVVFSLGVVLFERLTGRHPFGAENNRPRQVDRIRRGELGSGVNSFPTVAAGLRSVLVRAMSPFPEERWPDLRQVRELLGQFVAQESPAPRLPGTAEDNEQTRVVRMATDFGRELMQVVARHDQVPPRPPTQRLAIPTSGLGVVTGATQRRPSQATPKAGVLQLRPVTRPPTTPPPPSPEPANDSVVTKIRDEPVDPLAETRRVYLDDLHIQRGIDRALKDESAPHPVPAPAPALGPAPEPAPAPDPGPAVPAPAPAPAPVLGPPQTLIPPPTIAFDSLDLRSGTPRRRTATVAIVSGAVGAAVAVVLVLSLRSSPSSTAAAVSVPEAPPSPPAAPAVVTAPEPALTPAAPPAPAAVDPAPAPVASAPEVTTEILLARAIASCFPGSTGVRISGVGALYRNKTVRKTYFASEDVLTFREHSCMNKALVGLVVPDAPSGIVEYKIRLDGPELTVKVR